MQKNINQTKPGLAAVENGKLKIFDPSPGEQPAKIIAAEGIVLKINGEQIDSETEVNQNDTIETVPKSELTPAEINIDVSKDKMAAYLEIKPEIKITFSLKDQPPTPNLVLATEQQTKLQIPYSIADILNLIKKKGIVQPDLQAVKETLDIAGGKKVLIAFGTAPTPPLDEKVEINIPSGKTAPLVKADGRVDYRESASNISSVDQGDILAVKQPSAQGEPGHDVFGNIIKPNEPRTISMQAGPGTELIEEKTKVVATKAGQPDIRAGKDSYYFTVQPNMIHNGSVNLDSGNIRFKGDVHIKGTIEQNMVVSGNGKVRVDGLISSATVTSGSHITLNGHVLASKISAGAAISSISRILPLLEDLEQLMSQLQMALKQTFAQLKGQTSFGKVTALLMEKRFPSFQSNINNILKIYSKDASLPREIESLAAILNQKFRGIKVLELSGIEDIKELSEAVHKTKTHLEFLTDNKANIQLPYSLNSTIEATGNAIITGQGCIETKIIAGGTVMVQGLFRGGSIEAGDNVTLSEAGSKTGVPTHIKVPADKSVFFTKAYENVTLEIGEQHYLINQIKNHNEARLDVYGVVEFVKWTPGKKSTKPKS